MSDGVVDRIAIGVAAPVGRTFACDSLEAGVLEQVEPLGDVEQLRVEGLGLEVAGVDFDRRAGVTVDDGLRTSNKRIFAAGDVCSRFKFTHTADAMARIVLRNALFFGREKASALIVPWCTFTDPEVAHVGLSPEDANVAGIPTETIRVDLADVERPPMNRIPEYRRKRGLTDT